MTYQFRLIFLAVQAEGRAFAAEALKNHTLIPEEPTYECLDRIIWNWLSCNMRSSTTLRETIKA